MAKIHYKTDKNGNLVPMIQAQLVVVDDEDVIDIQSSGAMPTLASQGNFIKDNKTGDTTIPQ